jgi:hypothetical protein
MTLFCLLFLFLSFAKIQIQITKHSTHEIKKKTKELAQYNHAVTGTMKTANVHGNINIVGKLALLQ